MQLQVSNLQKMKTNVQLILFKINNRCNIQMSLQQWLVSHVVPFIQVYIQIHTKLKSSRQKVKFKGEQMLEIVNGHEGNQLLVHETRSKSVTNLSYHFWVTRIIQILFVRPVIHAVLLKWAITICIQPLTFLNFAAIRALHNSLGIKCRANAVWKNCEAKLRVWRGKTCRINDIHKKYDSFQIYTLIEKLYI